MLMQQKQVQQQQVQVQRQSDSSTRTLQRRKQKRQKQLGVLQEDVQQDLLRKELQYSTFMEMEAHARTATWD